MDQTNTFTTGASQQIQVWEAVARIFDWTLPTGFVVAGAKKIIKSNIRRLAGAALVLVAGIGVTACASQTAFESAPDMAVERVSSQRFEFDWVRAQRRPHDIQVRGDVSRRISQRGPIPGYVHVSVIGPDGVVLAETDAPLMRRNKQARSAHFYARLPATPPPGSSLQVEHVTARTAAG